MLGQKEGDGNLDSQVEAMPSASPKEILVHGRRVCEEVFSCFCRITYFHTGVHF